MTKKNILQKKFEEIDILKGLLLNYPIDYRNCVLDKIEEISIEISDYLDDSKRVPKEFTLDEVAKHNGKDGMPGYVVINGTVYDTSKIEAWSGGNHFGVSAGTDVTQYFAICHSNEDNILKKLIPVGVLKG